MKTKIIYVETIGCKEIYQTEGELPQIGTTFVIDEDDVIQNCPYLCGYKYYRVAEMTGKINSDGYVIFLKPIRHEEENVYYERYLKTKKGYIYGRR